MQVSRLIGRILRNWNFINHFSKLFFHIDLAPKLWFHMTRRTIDSYLEKYLFFLQYLNNLVSLEKVCHETKFELSLSVFIQGSDA